MPQERILDLTSSLKECQRMLSDALSAAEAASDARDQVGRRMLEGGVGGAPELSASDVVRFFCFSIYRVLWGSEDGLAK